ncbi:MAG: 4-hydroxy-3-methylbut-2-enyl diphosphate reductase [Bacteroidales bacterium]|nr:4-hydroxy-3-methylbut-2-enyl diphosphate reductase [Bacteroidales bacterium]
MKLSIDKSAGFCFGVVRAIETAERELERSGHLYCLGEIVHNQTEIARLKARGLEIIDHEQFRQMHDCKVLIRAHGEPPETYRIAEENNIELIDASCPIVLKLQQRVAKSYEELKKQNGQVVIFGKQNHPEVTGLSGHTAHEAIVIRKPGDVKKVDKDKPVHLYAQTTMNTGEFREVSSLLENRLSSVKGSEFKSFNTICRQMANRVPDLKAFAREQDVMVFVSGKNSSNGNFLFSVSRSVNPETYFISNKTELQPGWFEGKERIGISGATSTPMWLMEEVGEEVERMAGGG